MSRIPLHPVLARRGIVPGVNAPIVVPRVSTQAESPRSSPRAEMLDTLPSLLTLRGGVQIASSPGAIVSGDGCGLPLIDILIDDYGEELWLNGITLTQGPCDAAGGNATDDGDSLLWGDRFGRRACVMIGVDLLKTPLTNGWYTCPCNDASFNRATGGVWTAGSPNQGGESNTMFWSQSFPAGRLSDAAIFKRVSSKGFGALGARIGLGKRLQAVWVLPADTFTDSELPMIADIDVQLHLGRTYAPAGFSESAP
jgi:hypothetical protein